MKDDIEIDGKIYRLVSSNNSTCEGCAFEGKKTLSLDKLRYDCDILMTYKKLPLCKARHVYKDVTVLDIQII